MALLIRSGIQLELPGGWEGRISTRIPETAPATALDLQIARADRSTSLLHVANFALPAEVADFGGGVVEAMGADHVFVALIEYDRASATTPLFDQRRQLPVPLQAQDFDPLALQRSLPGQTGTQRFFTTAGRAFCLYVVLGSRFLRARLIPLVNDTLRTLRIS